MNLPYRVWGIEQRADQVVATIEQDGRQQRISARLLVAADGVVSQVRDLLHTE